MVITRRQFIGTALVLASFGLWQVGHGAYIFGKAQLAQLLIRKAWSKSLATGADVKPWPWADTWAVARLQAPRLGVSLFVLDGASGEALAFGPGYLHGTSMPGSDGNTVLAGHRDTHFKFLRHLQLGDELAVEAKNGRTTRYKVEFTQVVPETDTRIVSGGDDTRLTLITCYPFDALSAGTPLRYVVVARPVEKSTPVRMDRWRALAMQQF